jgi:hypothetical protein
LGPGGETPPPSLAREATCADGGRSSAGPPWKPNPGPQSQALSTPADELLYGGQAGGGKTDLLLGLALTAHKRSLILRRINKDALKLVPRLVEILGSRNGYNGQLQRWTAGAIGAGRQIDFGGCEFEDDKQRYKGDPHDLIGFDEGTDFNYSQYRFIIGWNRSADGDQRCRVVVTSNPPTTAEGMWVIAHWRAWLDPLHPNPAKPGELRWYTTGPKGEDLEVNGRGPYEIPGSSPGTRRMVRARSRTYIPARLEDNPYLAGTDYASVLDALPEELRRAYRDGNFFAGLSDQEFQVIPTAWIEAAQARWVPDIPRGRAMTAIGVDVAQGGSDSTVLAARYGGWYGPLLRASGATTRTGDDVAALVIRVRRDCCPVIIDVGGGWGADAVGVLERNGIPVVGFLGQRPSSRKDRNGQLKFKNKRAEAWWRFREALDPDQEGGSAIALPPNATIKADLAAPTFEVRSGEIVIEAKDAIKKRLGRSPDDGDAIVMALSEGDAALMRERQRGMGRPQVNRGYAEIKQSFRR